MKKRLLIVILFVMVLFLIPKNADAVGICPAKQLSKLQTEALKVKVIYNQERSYEDVTMFRFSVLNLSDNLEFEFNGSKYSGSKDTESILVNGLYEDNNEYSFKIYSKDLKVCGKAYLTTKKVTIPKYNIYSEYQECVEYEEFPLCDPWYDGEIKDSKDFLQQLGAYIESTKSKVEEYKDERSIFQKIADWCSDNIEITVVIVTILVIAITIPIAIKINKIRKRVKVKL